MQKTLPVTAPRATRGFAGCRSGKPIYGAIRIDARSRTGIRGLMTDDGFRRGDQASPTQACLQGLRIDD